MKNNVLFSLICLVSLLSCEPVYVTDELLMNEKPYNLKVRSTSDLLRNGSYALVAKDVGGGTNYYFTYENANETFLFLTCDVDCNQYIAEKQWDAVSNSFAVLIRSRFKVNFETSNRLILYQVIDNKPVELLDTVKEVYKTFRFEDKKFIYTLQDGTERVIELK